MPEVSGDRFRLLAEICLTAMAEGQFQHATELADALQAARPEDETTFVARILLHVCRQDAQQAISLSEKAASLHPESCTLGAFRALALVAGGYRSQAEMILEPLTAAGGDKTVAALAKALLERDLHDDVRKKDLP